MLMIFWLLCCQYYFFNNIILIQVVPAKIDSVLLGVTSPIPTPKTQRVKKISSNPTIYEMHYTNEKPMKAWEFYSFANANGFTGT